MLLQPPPVAAGFLSHVSRGTWHLLGYFLENNNNNTHACCAEWFKATSIPPKVAHALNYTVPVAAVDGWIESEVGLPEATFDAMHAFLLTVEDAPIEHASQIMARGLPWGMLQEKLVSTQGGDGMLSKSQLYTGGVNVTAQLLQAQPWLELVETGTFSAATLNRLPTSFMVSAGWVRLLKTSARNFTRTNSVWPARSHSVRNTSGSVTAKQTAEATNIPAGSWLHLFHLGVAYAEAGDAEAARAHHLASHALRPSPTNSRNLALMADVSDPPPRASP
jgi:hypothetical protein